MSCKDHNGNTCEINKSLCIGEEECEKAKLLQEIKELKEEQRLFTLEAKKLVAQYSAKLEWYKQTLQEIKAIAEYLMTSDTEKWTLDEPFKQIEKILELTKAEEE